MRNVMQVQVEGMGGSELVALYNQLSPEKPVKRFASRAAGVRRVLAALEAVEADGKADATAAQVHESPAVVAAPTPPEELARIIRASLSGPKHRSISGPDRAMLYRLAAGTGFRAGKLASLTPEAFDLTGTTTVTLEARSSKHRRADVQPIRNDLAACWGPGSKASADTRRYSGGGWGERLTCWRLIWALPALNGSTRV